MEDEAAPGGVPDFYFRSIEDSANKARWFVAADLRRHPKDPAELDEATLDITVTDGPHAWRGEGAPRLVSLFSGPRPVHLLTSHPPLQASLSYP